MLLAAGQFCPLLTTRGFPAWWLLVPESAHPDASTPPPPWAPRLQANASDALTLPGEVNVTDLEPLPDANATLPSEPLPDANATLPDANVTLPSEPLPDANVTMPMINDTTVGGSCGQLQR
jgi:hypothetical protein